MEEQIKTIEAVLASLKTVRTDSPFMHVAIGGLTTAVDNLRSYATKAPSGAATAPGGAKTRGSLG